MNGISCIKILFRKRLANTKSRFRAPRLPLLSMPRIAPPVPYYYRYPYGVYYRRYYASPGIHISVRL